MQEYDTFSAIYKKNALGMVVDMVLQEGMSWCITVKPLI